VCYKQNGVCLSSFSTFRCIFAENVLVNGNQDDWILHVVLEEGSGVTTDIFKRMEVAGEYVSVSIKRLEFNHAVSRNVEHRLF